MLQHSRIRAMYNIDGTTADDCCSAYACPNCTLMQDDREIRAREYKDGKNEKKFGTINHQPTTQPDMQYAGPNLFGDEPVQHRGSLVREKLTTVVTEQNQGSRNHGPNLENQQGAEHSKHHNKHKKKLHKTSKIDMNGHQPKGMGRMAYNNHESDASSNRSTCTDSPAYPDHEGRDAILASRQNWRKQKLSGKQEGYPNHTIAACPEDGARGSENHDPVTPRHTLLDYSEDASMNQVRGKRVLKQLVKVEGHTARSTAVGASEGPADESVLVFYDDGDHPQRHRLADFDRLRASTLGRTDTPHHNELPAGWREEKTIGGNGEPEASKTHDLAACPDVVVTEHFKPLDPHHTLKDRAAGDNNKAEGVKQQHCESHSLDACLGDTTKSVPDAKKHQSLPHFLKDCTGDVTTTTKESAQPGLGPDLIEQRRLDECATDIITAAAYSEPAGGISQHHLTECAGKIPGLGPATPTILDQHVIADCAVIVDARNSEPSTLDQHDLTDCAITSEAQSSEASDDIYSGPKVHSHISHDHSRSNQTIEQNESHTVTIIVPQPPVIIVTTSDVLEATAEQQDHTRSKSPQIVIMSNDSTTSTEHVAGPSNSKDHDGPTDAKDGQQQPSEAASALRNVLCAADDARHGKTTTELEGNDPTVVDANGSAKKSSRRSRSKASGGRAQKHKGK